MEKYNVDLQKKYNNLKVWFWKLTLFLFSRAKCVYDSIYVPSVTDLTVPAHFFVYKIDHRLS